MRKIISLLEIILFCTVSSSCESKKNVQLDIKERIHVQGRDFHSKLENEVIVEEIEDLSIFHYRYDSINYKIEVSNKYYSNFLPLFKNGVLHPKLINCFKRTVMSVRQFEELSKTYDGTKRRYKL